MNSRDLLIEIARCKNFCNCVDHSNINSRCYKLVSSQKIGEVEPILPDIFQLPEPWSGSLKAPLLFIGSNPGLCKGEVFPTLSWSDEEIHDFFTHRFSGGKRLWVKKFLYPLCKDEYQKATNGYKNNYIRFWASLRKRAIEITGNKSIIPGVDYAITEATHCKSTRVNRSISEAFTECTSMYLNRILSISNARIIIAMGKLARKAMEENFQINFTGNSFGNVIIGNIERKVVFLPQTNAYKLRRVMDWLDDDEINTLHAIYKDSITN